MSNKESWFKPNYYMVECVKCGKVFGTRNIESFHHEYPNCPACNHGYRKHKRGRR